MDGLATRLEAARVECKWMFIFSTSDRNFMGTDRIATKIINRRTSYEN